MVGVVAVTLVIGLAQVVRLMQVRPLGGSVVEQVDETWWVIEDMAPFIQTGWRPPGAGGTIQVAEPGSPTLARPAYPPGYSDLHMGDDFADGTVAATVYGYTQHAPAAVPCLLAINDGTATVYRQLVCELDLSDSWIVPYNRGRGLLVFVDGTVPLSRDWRDLEVWQGLFMLEAPEWAPRLVTDSESLGLNNMVSLVGQSADGSKIWLYGGYVYRKHANAAPYASGGQLWVYDAIADTTELVCSTHSAGRVPARGPKHVAYVIPSPDEDMLALVYPHPFPPYSPRLPVRVVDCGSGTMHTLTSQLGMRYEHRPLGWSATVPRRLYFIDLDHDVWRLDIP